MIEETLRHGGLLKDTLEREVGKKWGRGRARLEYFPQKMKDMGWEIYKRSERVGFG